MFRKRFKMEDYIELMEDAGDQIDNVCMFIEKKIIKNDNIGFLRSLIV